MSVPVSGPPTVAEPPLPVVVQQPVPVQIPDTNTIQIHAEGVPNAQ